jgi:hypothetical protein
MRLHRPLCALAFIATSAAAAGTYDGPWAIVEGADASSVRNEFRPAITQIDGKSTRDTRESDALAPGPHQVKIRFQTGRVAQSPADEERLLDLDLEGCTRYRIAAQRTTGTQWQPKVYSEKIGECMRKFEGKK